MTTPIFSQFLSRSVYRILLIVALALLGALAVAPRVASQDPQTLELDVVTDFQNFKLVPAAGNPILEGFPQRGDILSGQGAVYAAGDRETRIGTFYFMGVGTGDAEHAETAANHLYATGYFEIWGEGTLAVTAAVSFFQPGWVAIVGGTGRYAMAHGQCLERPLEDHDSWTCEIQ